MRKILEKSFNRAFILSFSKKKFFLTFPVLVLSGILIIFCRALAEEASGWISMSLIFLPILLSSGILLSLGVLLIRIYHKEAKGEKVHYRNLISHSWDFIVGTSYLSIPPVLIYLLLWVILGIFFLFREIPGIGDFIGVIFSFGPFLLFLSALILCICNLLLLFFAAPTIALRTMDRLKLTHSVFKRLTSNIYGNAVQFFLALFPSVIVISILSFAALLTNWSYLVFDSTLSMALSWFFIMLPFCALLTPSVIFYFNFAAESYNSYKKMQKI